MPKRYRPEYRALYPLSAWRPFRKRILDRDGWQCQWPGCGRLLIGKAPAPNSPVVHHKKDHKGEMVLFLDPENAMAACKECHDSAIQRSTHRGYPNPVITSISYTDPLGVAGTVTEWEIRDGKLYVEDKPEVSTVSVVFNAGLGAGNIPPKLVQAALMLTASFYLQRADLTTDPANSVPMGVRAMIAQHRSFAFA